MNITSAEADWTGYAQRDHPVSSSGYCNGCHGTHLCQLPLICGSYTESSWEYLKCGVANHLQDVL